MIREAEAADVRGVYELICGMEQTRLDPGAFQEIYRAQRASALYLCLVWEERGRILGCLNLRMEPQLHHTALVAEVLELAVEEGRRSQGIGKALLDEACRRAREQGCVQIEVCCNRLRTEAHRFYQREGLRDFHLKRSKSLTAEEHRENRLGL